MESMTHTPTIAEAFELADKMLTTLLAEGIAPYYVQAATYTQPVTMGVEPEHLDPAAELLGCGPARAPSKHGNVYRECDSVQLFCGRERWQAATGLRPVTS